MITLSANNLVKAYKGRKVVDRVSLEVNKGEIVGFLDLMEQEKQQLSI